MVNTYGYVRVSDISQCENRQLDAMISVGVLRKHIFVDKQSGRDFERPAYRRLTRRLKSGDLLFIDSVDRIGRNYEEIQNQWRLLTKEKGVDIAVLDMPLLDTRQHKDLMGTFVADLVLQVMSFMGQRELEHIRKRQADGIAAAKMRGIHLGRPAKKLPINFDILANAWAHRELTTSEFIKIAGIPESTLYRRLREYQVVRD